MDLKTLKSNMEDLRDECLSFVFFTQMYHSEFQRRSSINKLVAALVVLILYLAGFYMKDLGKLIHSSQYWLWGFGYLLIFIGLIVVTRLILVRDPLGLVPDSVIKDTLLGKKAERKEDGLVLNVKALAFSNNQINNKRENILYTGIISVLFSILVNVALKVSIVSSGGDL